MSSPPTRLPHSHEQFVNREKQLELVLDLVERVADDDPLDRRTVIFHGHRGTGKSWLLSELHYQLEGGKHALTIFLDLADWKNQGSEAAVQEMIRLVHQAVAHEISPAAVDLQETNDLYQLANWLVADVSKLRRALVLLLDHVDESKALLLKELELRLLGPLINVPAVILVLAGRGRRYPWKNPGLRIRSSEVDLLPFALIETEEQLKKQVPFSELPMTEIFEMTGGYPWPNYLLGTNPKKLAIGLEHCITVLINNLLDEADPTVERAYLEALCVLRAFSDAMIPCILSAYFNNPTYLDWSYSECRQLRQSLIRTTLAKWVESSGGYVIDDALNRVLGHWLYVTQSDTWTTLHIAARDMFLAWIPRYPNQAERWRVEAMYHDGKLSSGP